MVSAEKHHNKINPPADYTHQSKGVNLTQSRLELDNCYSNERPALKTLIKKMNGKAAGTKVIITIKEET